MTNPNLSLSAIMATTEEEQQQLPNSMIIKKKKGGKGRQKIEIKKIMRTSNRQVAFSKRRKSLFKNAEDLSLKYRDSARVAVFALSENGRQYSYGNSPDAETLINQFLGVGNGCNDDTAPVMGSEDDLERYMAYLLEERAEVAKKLNEIMVVEDTVSASTGSDDVTRWCDAKKETMNNGDLGLLYDDFETWMNGFYENNKVSACTTSTDVTHVCDVKNDQTMNDGDFETWMNGVFESIDDNLELFNDDINNLDFF